jgi:hypothetical protein
MCFSRHYGETDLGLQSCADYSARWQGLTEQRGIACEVIAVLSRHRRPECALDRRGARRCDALRCGAPGDGVYGPRVIGNIRAARVTAAAGSPKPAMPTCDAFSSKQPGITATGRRLGHICASVNAARRRRRFDVPGWRSIASTGGIDGSLPAANHRRLPPRRSRVNSQRLSGRRWRRDRIG